MPKGIYIRKPGRPGNNQSAGGQSQTKNYRKAYQIQYRYNLTPELYLSFFDLQDYKCAGCGKKLEPYTKDAHIDHDHSKSGYDSVRGILCHKCNRDVEAYLRVKSWVENYFK